MTAPSPADLLEALHAQGLLPTYEALPPSHRAEYVRWIDEAKRESTRAARIVKTVAMLTARLADITYHRRTDGGT